MKLNARPKLSSQLGLQFCLQAQAKKVCLAVAPNPVLGSFSILNENEMPHPAQDVKDVCKDFLPESSHYIIPELS